MDDSFFTDFKIGIAGLGLIGGSLAMSFKKAGFYVSGYDIDATTVKAAKECGAVDEAANDPRAVLDADCLFVALYPEDTIEFVIQNAQRIKKGAIVIDCCGVKTYVTSRLLPVASQNGFLLLGGHPMAGTERVGFAAAHEGLFLGASFILTPSGGLPDAICDKVKTLLKSAGFERIVVTTPAHHDRMIAFTSQLPHLLACAYVRSPCCPQHKGYSAGSYRDVSRVAHINPELWAELFADNSAALCEEIDELMKNLSELRAAVAAGDRAALTSLLHEAHAIKDGVDLES